MVGLFFFYMNRVCIRTRVLEYVFATRVRDLWPHDVFAHKIAIELSPMAAFAGTHPCITIKQFSVQ